MVAQPPTSSPIGDPSCWGRGVQRVCEGVPRISAGPSRKAGDGDDYGWFQWIGLRENLQETIDFPIKYGVFL